MFISKNTYVVTIVVCVKEDLSSVSFGAVRVYFFSFYCCLKIKN